MSHRVLYICYDGALSPLGQSQVINLLLEITKQGGYEFSLISFEKPTDLSSQTFSTTAEKLSKAGIEWKFLPYHRRPTGLATMYDVACGFLHSLRLIRKHRISIIHARSYVPAAIAYALKLFTKTPFIFDMRGFWADEKVDVGTISKASLPYRLSKFVEGRLLRNANVIASLSNAGVREMHTWSSVKEIHPRFEVVSTYTNLDLFKEKKRKGTSPFTVGYVGGAQGWYMIDPFLEVFRAVRKTLPEAKLLILNRYDQEFLEKKIAEFEIPFSSVELKAVEHDEVAGEMARMDCAAFFIRPSYSKIASAPTKLGELLACGIPCLTNSGVGDVEEILNTSGAGLVVKGFTKPDIEEGVARLLALARSPGAAERCQAAAEQYFSLERGAAKYRKIYESLLG